VEAAVRRIGLFAAAVLGLLGAAAAADQQDIRQPSTPAVPPASGSSSAELSRSGGVVVPPANVDPGIKQTPPPSGDRMPVIPPPDTAGGNPAVKPK
jgi:hypothetical protein